MPTNFVPSETLYAHCRSSDPQQQAAGYTQLWQYLVRCALKVVYDQPAAEAIAQDCAQIAITRIFQRIDECQHPAAFRSWSRQIVSRLAIDYLRRENRLLPLEPEQQEGDTAPALEYQQPDAGLDPAERVALNLDNQQLRELVAHAPLSERSRRVVLGRYFDNRLDEELAATESDLSGREVLPSHVQVTRAKNLAKMRSWPALLEMLGKLNEA